MMDWIYTALVLVVGVAVLVSGFIKVLYIGFFLLLGLCVLVYIIKRLILMSKSMTYKKDC